MNIFHSYFYFYRMIKLFFSWIFKVLGFQAVGEYPMHIKKMMVIVVPHTSNWDFPLGLLYKLSQGFSINYVGKESLFKPPFGWFFRWVGGIPVNRKKSMNFVKKVVNLYKERDALTLCIAPEGRRSKVDTLKTGYFFICKQANIPIVMIKFDWANKQIICREPYYLTGNDEADMAYVESYFRGTLGKIPENSFL